METLYCSCNIEPTTRNASETSTTNSTKAASRRTVKSKTSTSPTTKTTTKTETTTITITTKTTTIRALLHLFLLLLLSTTPVKSVKNCYVCHSHKSLEHCEFDQFAEHGCGNISNETSLCYIVERMNEEGNKIFGKHCIAEKMCNKETVCDPKETMCEVTCCTEPLCNRRKGYVGSGSVLGASFVWAWACGITIWVFVFWA